MVIVVKREAIYTLGPTGYTQKQEELVAPYKFNVPDGANEILKKALKINKEKEK